ncbi:hypothetical protein JTE90_018371 [Oedothorax gibbosus]|uniref:39S ribosomal protein L1, mitochondrial n=1 Tax=Oedothorax gibbosus TaxID=931172 RepID=A0AAV6UDQ7_9ARAC|nr:hypothetical protein JTE90_018371 [Oedothorax gibbosus]
MFTKTLFPTFTNFASKALRLNVLGVNSKTLNSAPALDIVRYAARKGTRAKADAKKRARKLAMQSQPAPVPKFMLRKEKLTPDSQRTRCTDENWLDTRPVDNVYSMKLYRGKPYSVSEAIKMHRESHAPEMLNDPSALIFASVELDLKLKKKDKYLEDLNGIVKFPNEFKTQKKNKVIVVCKSAEEQMKATEAGAVYAGSQTLVKQILAGSVQKDEFDYLICHPDMLKEVNSLRGILAKKFPNTYNGLLRLDIEQAVVSFINGIEYSLKRSSIEPDFGWVDLPFGRLDMPDEKLEENFKLVLDMVEKQKPSHTDDRLFITRTLLFCERSRERFKVPHWEYLQNYPVNGVIVEEVEDEIQAESAEKQA